MNNNQLTVITGLNKNVRLKGLHAEVNSRVMLCSVCNTIAFAALTTAVLQNNSISSLKGSLQKFHFLETLDVSNNQLRNLAKLAAALSKFRFLSFLNLKVCSIMDLFVSCVQFSCNCDAD